jgi:hypothetical protein
MNVYNILGQHAFWQVNKKIAKLVGLEAALLLSDLISKRQYFIENKDIQDGWFFNTSENIEIDTGLSPHQQKQSLNKLVENQFIEVKRYGIPARNHFFICDNKLLKFLTTGYENFLQLDVKDFNNINNNKEIKIKKKNKEYIKPSLTDITTYIQEKGYDTNIAQKFFDYYEAGDWHDSNGRKVKNWKQKLNSVWFKDENKVKKVNLPPNWQNMTLTQQEQWRSNNGK